MSYKFYVKDIKLSVISTQTLKLNQNRDDKLAI